MSEHHYREESILQRRQYKVAKDKIHRLATKEYRLGETAGRVKATQITDENSIVIVKIMIYI